jgi:3-methyladenine DNA glycosylase AlkD
MAPRRSRAAPPATRAGDVDAGRTARPDSALIEALRDSFAAHADPARAASMQAYMKSALPFHGIPAPLRRRLQAAAVRAHPLPDTRTLAATMRTLWRQARTREERYGAMELARVGTSAKLLDLSLLPVYEEMIVSGAWWDYCDDISGSALSRLLTEHPQEMKPLLRRWARGDDLWLRRAAMLCQRRIKAGFDAVLLYDCILPSIGGGRFADAFFIRKGIGWALRERSYAAPAEVQAFCREYDAQLASLTQREALKAIERAARKASAAAKTGRPAG